jgi:hypothetical protein
LVSQDGSEHAARQHARRRDRLSQAYAQPSPVVPSTPPPQKSEATATLLALAGTAVPIGGFLASIELGSGTGMLLSLGGAMFLPSAGHWYAGKLTTGGLTLRVAGGVLAGASLAILSGEDGEGSGLLPVFWVGVATMGVGALFDIARVSSEVERWNRTHAELRPAVVKMGDGYGVGLAGRF